MARGAKDARVKHFCTYFDSNYALRGLTLFRSMQEHCGQFVLHVLCCDDQVFEIVKRLELDNLRAYRLSEVEKFETRLAEVKPQRSRAEYLWTLSPIWPLFLLETQPEIELICYLDADLFFFYSDEPIWKEFGKDSILLVEHRFPPHRQRALENGRFNVGILAYRRDENGLTCLNWYRERCLEWCFDRHEDGKYGDQKYLDAFPTLFKGVHILENEGVNVALWNRENLELNQVNGHFTVNGVPLIIFHFHGLKTFKIGFYDPCVRSFHYGGVVASWRPVYNAYLAAMREALLWARGLELPILLVHARFGPYTGRELAEKMLRLEWRLSHLR